MVITTVVDPELFTPHANPVWYAFSSGTAHQQTMNYIIDLWINGAYVRRDKIAPEPDNGLGLWNPAAALSPYLFSDPVSATTDVAFVPAINPLAYYDIYIGESFSYLTYSSVTATVATITLHLNTAHPFVVGDWITVTSNVSDPMNVVNGKRQVTAVPTSTSLTIDGTMIYNLSNQSGRLRRTDGAAVVTSGLTSFTSRYVFQSAIPRSQFFNYAVGDVQVGNSTAKWGTNMPRAGFKMRTNGRLWLYNLFRVAADHVRVHTYGQTGSQVGEYRIPNTLSTVAYKALYARLGPQDLQDITGYTVMSGPALVINDDVVRYTIQWYDVTPQSDLLTINLDRQCQPPEEPVQLLFKDQRGSYVTALCAPHKRIIKKTNKQTFKKRGFTTSAAAPYIITDQSIAQHTVFTVDLEESFATSAVMKNKEDAEFFNELFLSTEVYEIQADGSLLPVVVNEGTREAVNPYLLKGPIRWNVQYSYAYDQPLNV